MLSIANSIAEFTRVRAAVGPGPTLGTDFHTRLSVAETASLLQKMPIGTHPTSQPLPKDALRKG